MPYLVPNNISAPKPPPLRYWPETPALLNGGLNLVDREWKVSDNQSPKVLNMWYREGELSKRWGQNYIEDSITVETPCFATYDKLYEGHIIKHCGTKLYKQDPVTETTTELFTGLTAAIGSFFKFGDKLYYLQAGKYLQYDGTTVSTVTPYIPVVIINRTPTGGGDTLENYNRIGKGFINKFNGNGSAVAYTLTDAALDATLVICTVDGVAKVETVDFTIDRTTGIVTFIVAPGAGTNNVVLTAYKTVQADIDTILKCTIAIPFGGQNDNRLFIGGNGTGYFYWTGISANGIDATYFAYNNYNVIGNSDEDITAFGKHYDTLTIHKESGEIFGETYTFNGTTGIFNTFPINQQYGCDCPGTMQNINNSLVWLNSRYGVCILVGTTVGSQRNAFPISRNIDPRLMKETNLKTASSVDFNGKYWLCINDKVYLWDYFISPYYSTGNPEADAQRLSWWYFDNINAFEFVVDGQDLYYADRTTGQLVKFHTAYDAGQFYDFGEAISAIYRYPIREMGNAVYEFSVLRGWVNVRGDTKTSFIVTYFTSDDPGGDPSTESIDVGSFLWNNFNWSIFTWGVIGPVYQWALSPYEKNIRYFGAEFANSEAGRDMNISSVIWQYNIGKMIK
jgi:hypothetical protein